MASKEACGEQTVCYSTKLVCNQIREAAKLAVGQDLTDAGITLPEHFTGEMDFHDHKRAARMSYYPGMTRTSAKVLTFESDSWYEVCRMLVFALC